MTSPTSRFGLNRTTRETKSSNSLVKVYMRNFGKGLLELSDSKVKFYVEKGRFSKNKELSREIPLADIESVTLEGKELIFSWKDNAHRFVFEDPTSAQQILNEVKASMQQPGEQSKQILCEKQEVVFESTAEEDEFEERLDEKYENKPQIQQELSKPYTQEFPPQKVQSEGQKSGECLPLEIQKQEVPKKLEITIGQRQDASNVLHTKVQKVSHDFVEKSVAKPEAQQKPTETPEIDEIAVDKNEKENSLLLEQPKVELSLQEKKPSNPQGEQPECPEQCNIDEALSVAMSIVDSLFDILRSLQGRVNWTFIDCCEKRSQKSFNALTINKIIEANLDFYLFSSAIAEHNVEAVSKETFCLLEFLNKVFEKLPSSEVFDPSVYPNYLGAKVALQSYYVLSDLILAAVVEDEEVEEETNHLVILLGTVSNIRRQAINLNEIVSLASKVESEHGKETDIAEVRRTFRTQLKLPTQEG
jgi:hypothetical protein